MQTTIYDLPRELLEEILGGISALFSCLFTFTCKEFFLSLSKFRICSTSILQIAIQGDIELYPRLVKYFQPLCLSGLGPLLTSFEAGHLEFIQNYFQFDIKEQNLSDLKQIEACAVKGGQLIFYSGSEDNLPSIENEEILSPSSGKDSKERTKSPLGTLHYGPSSSLS